jgi:hypothetical protein
MLFWLQNNVVVKRANVPEAGDTVEVTLANNLNANPGTTTTMNTLHSPGGGPVQVLYYISAAPRCSMETDEL